MTSLGHIDAVHPNPVAGGVLVEVVASHGIHGRAFAAGVPDALCSAVERSARDHVVGSRLDGIEQTRRRMVPYVGFDGVGAEAVAAAVIENALWDCQVRTLGISLCSALGGRARDSILFAREIQDVGGTERTPRAAAGEPTTLLIQQPVEATTSRSSAIARDALELPVDMASSSSNHVRWEDGRRLTVLDCTGSTVAEIHRWLGLDEAHRWDSLFASVSRAGIAWVRDLTILAELYGVPILIDARGHGDAQALAFNLAFHLPSIVAVIGSWTAGVPVESASTVDAEWPSKSIVYEALSATEAQLRALTG